MEEIGTTDFGGTLLKYYAAQGVVHGHCVHVLGMSENWGRELPGLSTTGGRKGESGGAEKGGREWGEDEDCLEWYERLPEIGASIRGRFHSFTE